LPQHSGIEATRGAGAGGAGGGSSGDGADVARNRNPRAGKNLSRRIDVKTEKLAEIVGPTPLMQQKVVFARHAGRATVSSHFFIFFSSSSVS
jgi:hypothetical protein